MFTGKHEEHPEHFSGYLDFPDDYWDLPRQEYIPQRSRKWVDVVGWTIAALMIGWPLVITLAQMVQKLLR